MCADTLSPPKHDFFFTTTHSLLSLVPSSIVLVTVLTHVLLSVCTFPSSLSSSAFPSLLSFPPTCNIVTLISCPHSLLSASFSCPCASRTHSYSQRQCDTHLPLSCTFAVHRASNATIQPFLSFRFYSVSNRQYCYPLQSLPSPLTQT
jgi:hypothetical protein